MEQETVVPAALCLRNLRAYMTVTEVWSLQNDGRGSLSFGLVLTQASPALCNIACDSCQVLQPSQQQELLCDDTPARPFESVSAVVFTVAGNPFLVVVNRLSGRPVVVPCKGDTATRNTIRAFYRYFGEVGAPLRLRTDRGP